MKFYRFGLVELNNCFQIKLIDYFFCFKTINNSNDNININLITKKREINNKINYLK